MARHVTKITINTLIHTFFSYITAGCVLLTLMPPLLILLIILPERIRTDNRLILAILDLLYRGLLGALFVPIRIAEQNNRVPSEPSIIVANHQSSIDVPMVGMLIDRKPHLWYALAYYARMPILGFLIGRLGFSLDREAASTAAHDFLRGMRIIKKRVCHTIIFPEGARYADGKVHDFLEGFALIARHTNRPVVPIYMPDNYLVYPPASFWIYFSSLRATIGPQFVREEGESDADFTVRVHDWFVAQER